MNTSHLYIDIEICRDESIPDDLFSIAKESNPNQYQFLPSYNKIIAIAIGGLKDNTFQVKSLKGTEEEMIRELFKFVDKYTLTGYNILSFDIPFICLRAMKYNIRIPNSLKVYGEKPWNLGSRFLDLMLAMKFTGARYYNLNDVCLLLDIPSPKQGIDGSMIQEFYDQGKITDIEEYNRQDVRACYDLHQKLLSLNVL